MVRDLQHSRMANLSYPCSGTPAWGDSKTRSQSFFRWYNHQHHHSGLGLMTPVMVHHGQAPHILAHRQVVLDAAFRSHPARFVRKPP